jgi:hypothetical protein
MRSLRLAFRLPVLTNAIEFIVSVSTLGKVIWMEAFRIVTAMAQYQWFTQLPSHKEPSELVRKHDSLFTDSAATLQPPITSAIQWPLPFPTPRIADGRPGILAELGKLLIKHLLRFQPFSCQGHARIGIWN